MSEGNGASDEAQAQWSETQRGEGPPRLTIVGGVVLTAAEIASVAGGRVVSGDPETRIVRWSIDSRTIGAGDLFVAVHGDRFDGHEFAAAALAAGAVGVLVARVPVLPQAGAGGPARVGSGQAPRPALVIQVDDTTRALQLAAREVRRRSGTRVVAITGSAGKTTTKELTAEFLAAKYSVFRNKGNFNNHIGLPLSLLALAARPDVAVVELGMNHAGEIRTLVGIAEPDVRVWTNVGDAHMGFFASVDAIADAKAELLEMARPSDLLVAGGDDARIRARMGRFSGRTLTFGLSDRADVYASLVDHRGLDGMAATVRTPRGTARIETPLLGTGNLLNLLAATAVATELGVSIDAVAERAAHVRPAPHRGELLRLPGGVTLIDDAYNSSPAALKRSLETVRNATGSARKVAILGEMLELGDHALRLHEECGWAAAASGLDLLIAAGGAPAQRLADAAKTAGLAPAAIAYVQNSAAAAELALRRVRPGDLVLVKGSHGVRMDVVVDRLKVEFA